MGKKTITVQLPITTHALPELSQELLTEWADPRQSTRVPYRAEATWKCLKGHEYKATRERRERYGHGCPVCAAATKPAPKAKTKPTPAPINPTSAGAGSIGGTTMPTPPPPIAAPTAAPHWGFISGERYERPGLGMRGYFDVIGLDGRITGAYEWERVNVAPMKSTGRVGHHVVVVDRSGSMYLDMDKVTATLIKLLGVAEYKRPDLLISVVSYSSYGDAIVHLNRVTTSGINAHAIDKIRMMRPSGMTCMSGGLRAALGLVSTTEDTIVSLHSDGYANDRSAYEERREILDVILPKFRVATMRPVTINTVAYRDSSDFGFLAQIANAGGGFCVRVGSVVGLYDALFNGHTRVVDAPQTLAVDVPPHVVLLRVNPKLRRVVLDVASVNTRRINVDSDDEAYRIRPCKEGAGKLPDGSSVIVMLAMARGLIGAGRVTAAKRIAISTGIGSMTRHARALTGSQIAEMAADLDALALAAEPSSPTRVVVSAAVSSGVTIPELLSILGDNRDAVLVHVPTLMENYQRQGVKRVPGSWENGKLVAPRFDVAPRRVGLPGSDGWCNMTSVEFNNSEATINLTVSQPVELVDKTQTENHTQTLDSLAVYPRILDVAGVSLEGLRTYRSYTVVGDGEVRVKSLPIRITRGATWEALARVGAVSGRWDPTKPIDLSLENRPLLRSYNEPEISSPAVIARSLYLVVLSRILSASFSDAEKSHGLSPEQVAALRERDISPNLYYSPRTTYPYGPKIADVRAAMASGAVDVRIRYQVNFGVGNILHSGYLRSANEFLQRHFVLTRDGAEILKPTMIDFFDAATDVRSKSPEEKRRLKLDAVDEFCLPIYLIALRRRTIDEIFPVPLGLVIDGAAGPWTSSRARRAALAVVDAELEKTRQGIREKVFYIGASGSVPDGWGPALSSAKMREWRPEMKISAADEECQFYAIGDGTVFSVRAEESLYSVK